MLTLSPEALGSAILERGYRVSWRLDRTTGPNTGNSELRLVAPDGVVTATAVGSSGEMIILVSPVGDPLAVPIDLTDCDRSDAP